MEEGNRYISEMYLPAYNEELSYDPIKKNAYLGPDYNTSFYHFVSQFSYFFANKICVS